MRLKNFVLSFFVSSFPITVVPSVEQADERIQRRSTVRLGIRLIHKICPEINLSNNEPSSTQQPTVPRSLRLRLSPKARKLIKQTSLIIHGSNSGTNNSSNGNVKSIVEADVVDGLNRVSKAKLLPYEEGMEKCLKKLRISTKLR